MSLGRALAGAASSSTTSSAAPPVPSRTAVLARLELDDVAAPSTAGRSPPIDGSDSSSIASARARHVRTGSRTRGDPPDRHPPRRDLSATQHDHVPTTTIIVFYAMKGGSGTTVTAALAALATQPHHSSSTSAVTWPTYSVGWRRRRPSTTGCSTSRSRTRRSTTSSSRSTRPHASASRLRPDRPQRRECSATPVVPRLARSQHHASVVVDAGTGIPHVNLVEQAGRSAVTRPCYLSLMKAARTGFRPDGVVVVRGTWTSARGRATSNEPSTRSILATIDEDPRIARLVDAGLLPIDAHRHRSPAAPTLGPARSPSALDRPWREAESGAAESRRRLRDVMVEQARSGTSLARQLERRVRRSVRRRRQRRDGHRPRAFRHHARMPTTRSRTGRTSTSEPTDSTDSAQRLGDTASARWPLDRIARCAVRSRRDPLECRTICRRSSRSARRRCRRRSASERRGADGRQVRVAAVGRRRHCRVELSRQTPVAGCGHSVTVRRMAPRAETDRRARTSDPRDDGDCRR